MNGSDHSILWNMLEKDGITKDNLQEHINAFAVYNTDGTDLYCPDCDEVVDVDIEFICTQCCNGQHGNCKGESWCDCQHVVR